MFTGIIRSKGRIEALERRGGDVRLRIAAPELDWASFEVGESIAVNGVCLTATRIHDDGFDTDVSNETLSVTSLGDVAAGDPVNLEPSLAIGDRLGGHIVSGHVDCMGTVRALEKDARSVRITIEIPAAFSRYAARKGSITVDGVSLTVNSVSGDTFSVNIIPHTAEVTIIGDYAPGRGVNIEVDMLARYLERRLARDDDGGISIDFLREHGYA